MPFDTERMCRLNGKKPTARDRWTAFYRLWRLSHRKTDSCYLDAEATDCFRILFADWRPRYLIESLGDTLCSRHKYPTFLRKSLLETARKERLYGEFWGEWEKWQERDKFVAMKVRQEQGIEVLPVEVAEVRRKFINMARAKAAEIGLEVPDDDAELLNFLRQRE